MKKFLLILLFAITGIATMSAIEKTQPLDLSGFTVWTTDNGISQGTWDNETKTLTPTAKWGGGAIWLGTKDASDFQTVVLKLADTCTQPVALTVQYSDDVEKKATIPAGEKIGSVILDEGKTIKSIWIQINSETFDGVKIKIDELYLYYKTATSIVLSTESVDADGDWNDYVTISNDLFTIAEAGDIVTLTATAKSEGESHQVLFQDAKNWGNLSSTSSPSVTGTTTVSLTLTEDILNTIKNNGLVVKGYYVTFNQVNLIKYYPNGFTLTVPTSSYATLYLPFKAKVPSGVKVYSAAAINESTITLSQLNTGSADFVLENKTPVIVKATAGEYTFDESTNDAAPINGTSQLEGTLVKTNVSTITSGTVYALATKDTKTGFYPVSTDSYIPANKAYLVRSASSPIEAFFFDEPTGIKITTCGEDSEQKMYNLSGQEVSGSKGIVIMNSVKRINR